MVDEEPPVPAFGTHDYWDNGYKTGEAPREWFIPYEKMSRFLKKRVPTTSKTLVIGCGTSKLTPEMYDDGFKDIKSMDFSETAIEQMRREYPNFEWDLENVLKMSYPDESFDFIMDKGTLDCMFFMDETNEKITQMLKEVWRVIKQGGFYAVVTCGCPMQRMSLLEDRTSYQFNCITWKEFEPPENQGYTHPSAFVYILKRL